MATPNLAYIFVSSSNGDTFTNALDSDMLIYPAAANQRILLGTQQNAPANLIISQSNTQMTGILTFSNASGSNVILSSNNCLGINMSNPTSTLHVGGTTTIQGDLTINNAVGIQGLTIYKRAGTNANITSTSVFGLSNDMTGLVLRTANSNNQSIQFLTSNQERARITSTGLIGVGTSNPNAQLHLTSNLQVDQGIQGQLTPYRIWDYTQPSPTYLPSSNIIGSNLVISTNLSPFPQAIQEGSMFFPGSNNNYLFLGSYNSRLVPGPTLPDFTLEMWVYLNTTPSNILGSNFPNIIGQMSPISESNTWAFGVDSLNRPSFYASNLNGRQFITPVSTTLANQSWNHLAVTMTSGLNLRMFVNGVLQTLNVSVGTSTGSGTNTINIIQPLKGNNAGSNNLIVGQYANVPFNGAITNLRYVHNAVLYTSNFTVSATPLPPAPTGSNLILLRTPTYNPVQVNNTLNVIDGIRGHCLPTDSFLSMDCFGVSAPNTSSNPPIFDSNFTRSIVFNRNQANILSFTPQYMSLATSGLTIVCAHTFRGNSNMQWERLVDFITPTTIRLTRSNTTSAYEFQLNSARISGGTTPFNQTTVITARYDPFTSNGTMQLWQNGSIVVNQINQSGNVGSDGISQIAYIGKGTGGEADLNGNIYHLSMYNRALTDKEVIDANAALLDVPTLSFASDNSFEIGNYNCKPAMNLRQDGTLQVAGPITALNTQSYQLLDYGISNVSMSGCVFGSVPTVPFSPFGPQEGSLYFNGSSNNYVEINNSVVNFNYDLVDFSLEAWIYPIANSSIISQYIIGGSVYNWVLYTTANNLAIFSPSGVNFIATSCIISLNTWNHVTMSYTSSSRSFRLGANGVISIPYTMPTWSYNSSSILRISSTNNNDNGSYNGYITGLRIITGSNIYTANYTVPTAPTDVYVNVSSNIPTRFLLRAPQNPGKVIIPKIGGTTQVQAYPPAAMTGSVTSFLNTTYGQGTYIAFASTEFSDANNAYAAWKAFDKNLSSYWATVASSYNSTSPFAYNGTVTTIDVNGVSYPGEFLQLQLPYAINLVSFFWSCFNSPSYIPSSYAILGSKDGVSWSLVYRQLTTSVNTQTQVVNCQIAYSAYRFVILTLQGSGSGTSLNFYEWILYGTQEAALNVNNQGLLGVATTQPTQSLEVTGNALFNGSISAQNMGMFRNKIINGTMEIDQRNAGAAVDIGAGTGLVYTVDRWASDRNITTGTIRIQRTALSSTDVGPFNAGFKFSLLCTAITALTNYSFWIIQQRVEGNVISDFGWNGNGSGSPVTLSFWFRAKQTGIYSICIRNFYPSGQSFIGRFQVNIADTWAYYTQIIPPPPGTGAQWGANNNLCQLQLQIGSIVTIPSQLASSTGWYAPGLSPETISNYTNWVGTINNYIQFTGVQLEKGTVATPFEFRPFAIEFMLCQRYLEVLTTILWAGDAPTSTFSRLVWHYKTTKRLRPTVTYIAQVAGTTLETGSTMNGDVYFAYFYNNTGTAAIQANARADADFYPV